MKSTPRYSPVFAVHAALLLLLLTAGIAAGSADHEATVRLTAMRAIGILLGAWIPGQFFTKHSVCVWAWEVKGATAVVLAGLGVLLCVVSAYSLLISVLR